MLYHLPKSSGGNTVLYLIVLYTNIGTYASRQAEPCNYIKVKSHLIWWAQSATGNSLWLLWLRGSWQTEPQGFNLEGI